MFIEDEIAATASRNGASAVCDRIAGLKLGVAGVLRAVELAVAARSGDGDHAKLPSSRARRAMRHARDDSSPALISTSFPPSAVAS